MAHIATAIMQIMGEYGNVNKATEVSDLCGIYRGVSAMALDARDGERLAHLAAHGWHGTGAATRFKDQTWHDAGHRAADAANL